MVTDAQLLDIADRVATKPRDQQPLTLALALVSAAFPDQADSAAELPLGERDRLLLRWRRTRWGDAITSITECPRCAAPVEVTLSTAELDALPAGAGGGTIERDGIPLRFRCPNSHDLMASRVAKDAEEAERILWRRCVTAAGDTPPEPTGQLRQAVASAMEEADPLAVVSLTATCPACQEPFEALFDVAAFVGAEVEVYARRLLREVHQFARAYGWREADILAMSAVRRRAYREMWDE